MRIKLYGLDKYNKIIASTVVDEDNADIFFEDVVKNNWELSTLSESLTDVGHINARKLQRAVVMFENIERRNE